MFRYHKRVIAIATLLSVTVAPADAYAATRQPPSTAEECGTGHLCFWNEERFQGEPREGRPPADACTRISIEARSAINHSGELVLLASDEQCEQIVAVLYPVDDKWAIDPPARSFLALSTE